MIATSIRAITSIGANDLKGRRVLVRCDFNVPVTDAGTVLDDLRIKKTIPTIAYLRKAGAKIVLVSHIEGKNAKLTGGLDSLLPIAHHLGTHYKEQFGEVLFIEDFLAEGVMDRVAHLAEGQVMLFENLRAYAGEKKNDMVFAEKLARYADIYVNDAFAVSHRAHASVVALPSLLPHYAGMQLMSEIEHLSKVFNPPRPFVFILGGAKFDTKLPLIQKFMIGDNAADSVLLGGALLNNILKEKGLPIGKSLVSEGDFNLGEVVSNPKLTIPDDVMVSSDSSPNVAHAHTKKISEVGPEDMIMDVGPSMTVKLESLLKTAKFVLWNGPMGNYELGFKDQTIAMARAVAESGVQSALGGGDTTAAVAELGFDDEHIHAQKAPNMFVSTGGGAMIEFLLNETLPGIEALR